MDVYVGEKLTKYSVQRGLSAIHESGRCSFTKEYEIKFY